MKKSEQVKWVEEVLNEWTLGGCGSSREVNSKQMIKFWRNELWTNESPSNKVGQVKILTIKLANRWSLRDKESLGLRNPSLLRY